MGTSQRDSLPGKSRVGKIIEDVIGDGNGNGNSDGGSKGGSIRYRVCLLDGLREIFRDEFLGSLEEIVSRCQTHAYEYISDGQEKQISRDYIIKTIFEQLKAYLQDGFEDRLADLLQKCIGKKIEKDYFIPGEDCERILFILYQDGLLLPALVESATLAYLYELEQIYFQVYQYDNLGVTLNMLYGIEELEDELALQIIENFNIKLISLHQHGKYKDSAITAANKALETLLGEPASLPFASAQEIKDYFGSKTLVDVMRTYYAKYLFSILEYHYSQVAPKLIGPNAGFEWTESSQQSGGHCDKTCTEKAKELTNALDSVCEQMTGQKIQDLRTLSPKQIRLFFDAGEERVRDALFPGSKRVFQLGREVAND